MCSKHEGISFIEKEKGTLRDNKLENMQTKTPQSSLLSCLGIPLQDDSNF